MSESESSVTVNVEDSSSITNDSGIELEDFFEEESEDNSLWIRAKWIYDGSRTIDEMIQCLEGQIQYLLQLKAEGWELREPVQDDYGFLVKSN